MVGFRRPVQAPLLVFGLILVLAFIAEYAVMIVLATVPLAKPGTVREALIDSTMLTLLLAPACWLVIYRPLQRLSRSRGQLLARLFDAQEQERARLARDLHDELGQYLTAMLMTLRAVEQAPDLDEARTRARTAANAGSAGLDAVRRISRGLRPVVLDDLGLGPAVERLCREFQTLHGITTECHVSLPAGMRLDPQAEVCVFRVVQEAMTNAARHASPSRVGVGLTSDAGRLELEVTDDGRGFEPSESTGEFFGVQGMRERVELLGGRFSVRSNPGRGTRIRVDLPLPA